jgi:hypothetical protein
MLRLSQAVTTALRLFKLYVLLIHLHSFNPRRVFCGCSGLLLSWPLVPLLQTFSSEWKGRRENCALVRQSQEGVIVVISSTEPAGNRHNRTVVLVDGPSYACYMLIWLFLDITLWGHCVKQERVGNDGDSDKSIGVHRQTALAICILRVQRLFTLVFRAVEAR